MGKDHGIGMTQLPVVDKDLVLLSSLGFPRVPIPPLLLQRIRHNPLTYSGHIWPSFTLRYAGLSRTLH